MGITVFEIDSYDVASPEVTTRYQCPNCKKTYQRDGYASVVFLNDVSYLVCTSVLPCCNGQYYVASVFETEEEAQSSNFQTIATLQSAQTNKALALREATEVVRLIQKDIGIYPKPHASPRDHQLNS